MRALVLLAGAIALSGCALLGKNEPQVPRYFTPEFEGDAHAVPAHPELHLRLGRIEGGAHLRERMVSRSTTRELVFAEDRRWTERPEVYLRRALARSFFEERGLTESLTGAAVTLDVELIAFEEVLTPPRRARLQALIILRDDRVGLLEETIAVEQPIEQASEAESARAVTDALSQALHAGVTRITDRVIVRLTQLSSRANDAPKRPTLQAKRE